MKPLLIIFIILLVVGLLLMFSAIHIFGGLRSNVEYVTCSERFSADCTVLRVSSSIADVSIHSTDGDEIEMEARTFKDRPFSFTESNGELTARQENNSEAWSWFGHFGISGFDSNKITVGIPESFSGELILQTTSGDIRINSLSAGKLTMQSASGKVLMSGVTVREDLNVHSSSGDQIYLNCTFEKEVLVKTSSGDIRLSESNASVLQLSTSSGDIRVNRLSAETLKLKSSSGEHILTGVTLNGDLSSNASSGELQISDSGIAGSIRSERRSGNTTLSHSSCTALIGIASSGNIRLNDLEASVLELEATSGDIRMSYVDLSESLTAYTTSGNVTCRFVNPESEFTVSASSRHGSCNRGFGGTGEKEIRISCTSGNIRLDFGK